jgi:hypothetical protein
MAERKQTTYRVLVARQEEPPAPQEWVEWLHLAVGSSPQQALLRMLDTGDIELASGDRVLLVPERSWNTIEVKLEETVKVVLK